MLVDELRAMIEEAEPPYTIRTKGGRSYCITDRAHLWAPEDETELIAVVIPRKGIFVLRVNAIESVQLEHERAGVS